MLLQIKQVNTSLFKRFVGGAPSENTLLALPAAQVDIADKVCSRYGKQFKLPSISIFDG